MHHRYHLPFLILSLSLLLSSLHADSQLAGTRPDIVLIFADDMGFSDLGCYGGEIQTPNLDQLAAAGLRFTQFYNCGKCAPTRASVMTGQYHHTVGIQNPVSTLKNCVTLGEVMKDAGYTTLYSGKWHAKPYPSKRGFERTYSSIGGANYFNPGETRPDELEPHHGANTRNFENTGVMKYTEWDIDGVIHSPYNPPEEDYYATDVYTDRAIGFLEESVSQDKPFFLCLPYTAPHWPLHARPEDIAKYRGTYMQGFEHYRQARYQRQLEMGLIDSRWALSEFDPTAQTEPWNDLTPEEQDLLDHKMAVYAAMVDRMDQNIGRLVSKLKQMGRYDNTLILFFSDNGNTKSSYNYTHDIPPGPINSYHSLLQSWANVSNTPYRYFKSSDHEGGICTPFIAHWPAQINRDGEITQEVAHVMDFMPTLIELAGTVYPATQTNGKALPPHYGHSLLPIFEGKPADPNRELYWMMGSNLAMREGPWKMVKYRAGDFELYNILEDRTEINNLASAEPEILNRMKAKWHTWALRAGADMTQLLEFMDKKGLDPLPIQPISQWAQDQGVISYNWEADQDHDGWPILFEYLSDTNPSLDSEQPQISSQLNEATQHLSISLMSQRDNLPSEIHIRMEGSVDLGINDPWQEVPMEVNVQAAPNGQWFHHFKQSQDLSSGGKPFIRLSVQD